MAEKYKDPSQYLKELLSKPVPSDPYKNLNKSLPVKTSSSSVSKDIYSKLGTVQSNRRLLEILKEKEKPKTRKGIVSTLLDPDKGILFAPARAGSAFVADITGIGDKKGFYSELSGNPLESAIRAAKGDFNITGGDIFKTEDADNILERGSKLVGALAWDVLTDPTSYFGVGGSPLSRRSIVEVASNPEVMKKVLGAVESKVAAKQLAATVADDIVLDLVKYNKRYLDGTLQIIDENVPLTRKFVNSDLVEFTTDEIKEIAADSLSNLVSEGFITKGRAGILDNLKIAFDSAEEIYPSLAKEVFETELPKQLAGGLYLINPVTGRRYTKIFGGHGNHNIASDAINAARFKASRSARKITGLVSGEYGEVWEAAMKDLHKDVANVKGSSRNLITDYLKTKEAFVNKTRIFNETSGPAFAWSKSVNAVYTYLKDTDAESADSFLEQVTKNISEFQRQTGSGIDGIEDLISESAIEALNKKESADKVTHFAKIWGLKGAAIFDSYGDQLLDAKLIKKLQPNYKPLAFTQAYLNHLKLTKPKQGSMGITFNTSKGREAFEIDPAKGKSTFEIDLAEDFDATDERLQKLFASPEEANEMATEVLDSNGKKIQLFETDPTILMSLYGNSVAKKLSINRTIKTLELTGVITRFPSIVTKTINATNAQTYVDTAKKLSVQTRSKLDKIIKDADAEVKRMSSRTYTKKENLKNAQVLVAVQKQYDDHIAVEFEIIKDITDTNNFLVNENIIDTVSSIMANFTGEVPKKIKTLLNNIDKDIKLNKKVNDAIVQYKKALKNFKSIEKKSKITEIDPVTNKETIVNISQSFLKRLSNATSEVNLAEKALLDASDALFNIKETVDSIAKQRKSIITFLDENTSSISVEASDVIKTYVAALNIKQVKYAQLTLERTNRIGIQNSLDLAKINTVELNSKAVNAAITAYTVSAAEYKKVSAELLGIPVKNRTKEQSSRLTKSKRSMKVSLDKIKIAIGYSSTHNPSAGDAYADKLIKLITGKTDNEIKLIQFFGNEANITKFINNAMKGTEYSDVQLNIIEDLMKSYASLRESISVEDLNELDASSRRVFLQKKGIQEKVVVKELAPEESRIGNLIQDLEIAKTKGDEETISKLELKIKQLTSRISSVDNKKLEDLREKLVVAIEAGNTKTINKLEILIQRLKNQDTSSMIGSDVANFSSVAFKDIYANDGVRKLIEESYKIRSNTDDWERYIRNIYDPIAFVWKTQATVGRGYGYVFNNLVSGSVANYIGGVRVVDNREAAAIIHNFLNVVEQVKKDFKVPKNVKKNTDKLLTTSIEDEVFKRTKDIFKKVITLEDGTTITHWEMLEKILKSGAWMNTQTVATVDDLVKSGLGKPITAKELASNFGISFNWQTEVTSTAEQRFRKVVDYMLTNPVQSHFNDLAQRSEMFVRLAAYIRAYKVYGNERSALSFVNALHFDYKDASAFELWVKRFVPFYVWNRNSIPLQMRAMFFQPDKIKKLVLVNENFKKAFGNDDEDSWVNDFLPEWADTQGGFVSKFKFMGNPIGLFPRLPLYDIDKLTQVVYVHGFPIITPRTQQFASLLGPIVTPLEYISGVNFDTGIPYEDEWDKTQRLASNMVPMWGTATRVLSAGTIPLSLAGVDLPFDDFIKQERGMSNLLNLTVGSASGYSAFTLSEKQLLTGLYQTISSQNEQVGRAAAEANIDLEWLRKQIKAGKSIAEIRILIAKGDGNVELWEKIRERKGLTEPKRDYNQVLEGLRTGQSLTGY